MNKADAVSYALDFTSFLARKKEIFKNINNVILFGSAARGETDAESDVDIFIDVKENSRFIEKEIEKELKIYNISKQKELWELRGIKNPISLKIGQLKEWKAIKRAILTDGILLYGKYEGFAENLRHFTLFKLDFKKMRRSQQVSLWRKLYGYRQKVGKKIYEKEGLIRKSNGRKLENGIAIVPIENVQEISSFLKKHKINYEIFELWSDSFY